MCIFSNFCETEAVVWYQENQKEQPSLSQELHSDLFLQAK